MAYRASHADVLTSINRAISTIHAAASKTAGGYTEEQRSNLRKLEKHREAYISEHNLSGNVGVTASRPAPAIPESSQNGAGKAVVSASGPSSLDIQIDTAPIEPVYQPPKQKANDSKHKATVDKTEVQSVSSNTHTQNNQTSQKKLPIMQEDNASISTVKNAIVNLDGEPSLSKKTVSSANVFASPCVSRSKGSSIGDLNVPGSLGADLVEKMRTSTGLSYRDSMDAVSMVVCGIGENMPGIQKVMERILETLQSDELDADLSCDDAKRLKHIFWQLADCKDDSQQRSWFLHEDEHLIGGLLDELLGILNGANGDLCRAVIATDEYAAIHNLVVYYQMETRSGLRMLLLQVFGSLCGISSRIISELLNSVLPSELARDILSDTQDIQKFYFSCLVLAMVFSMGESPPLQYDSQLNQQFVSSMLEMVENPPDTDKEVKASDLLINVVLAFNLHFELPSENVVMKEFAERKTAKVFTEKILLFVNRGDDPVRLFEHQPKPANSVLKFLADLYSQPTTSDLLYTNDVKVLIDIILRQITDLTAGDTVRTEHLSILELLLKNHSYSEHMHRRQELETCFKRIYQEDDVQQDFDKRIVAQIWRDNPDLFEN